LSYALLEGIALGGVVSISTGPTFLTLIETSLTNGYRKAIALALAVVSTDAFYIFLGHQGINFLDGGGPMTGLKVAGGLVFLFLGVKKLAFENHADQNTESKPPRQLSYFQSFIKGLAVNGLNPFLLIFWTGVVGLYRVKVSDPSQKAVLFYIGILVTTFTFDILKSVFAHKFRRFFSGKIFGWLMKFFGIVFIGISLAFFAETFGFSFKAYISSLFASVDTPSLF